MIKKKDLFSSQIITNDSQYTNEPSNNQSGIKTVLIFFENRCGFVDTMLGKERWGESLSVYVITGGVEEVQSEQC